MIGEAEGAAGGNPAPTIAIMAMLIATASSNGVGPRTWLADLLARIADHAFQNDQPMARIARRRRLRFHHIAIPGGTKCQRVVMGVFTTAVAVNKPEE
jgi:hypothetical protein